MKKSKLEELLYKSFDSPGLSGREQALLNEALESSPELRKLRDEILSIRSSVKETRQSDFSPYFESRLLSKINRRAENIRGSLAESLSVSFRRVALSAAIVLLVLVTYNLNAGNDGIISYLFGITSETVEYAFDPATQLIWPGIQ